MPRTFVDLSIYLENDVISDPPPFGAEDPVHQAREHAARRSRGFFPGLKKEDLPDGEGWAVENVQLIDAQRHASRRALPLPLDDEQARRARAIAIDEVPLDWCFQPGVKLDFRHLPDGYVVTADDVEAELEAHRPRAASRSRSSWSTRAPARATATTTTSTAGCGMGYEATMYLLERGVRLTGTDAWSWDAPFVYTAKKYGETSDAVADLGRPQGRPRHRLLPPREAAQPRGAAGRRLLHRLLPAQDPRRLGRLDARGRDLRRRADGQRLRSSIMTTLNHTHDATVRSWLASANASGGDFPIQNLPFAVFHRAGERRADARRRGDRRPGDRSRRPVRGAVARWPGAGRRTRLCPAGAERLLRARPGCMAGTPPCAVRAPERRRRTRQPRSAARLPGASGLRCVRAARTHRRLHRLSTPRSTMR